MFFPCDMHKRESDKNASVQQSMAVETRSNSEVDKLIKLVYR